MLVQKKQFPEKVRFIYEHSKAMGKTTPGRTKGRDTADLMRMR